MPLDDGLLIACKDGVVELTATLGDPESDAPAALGEAVAERVRRHRHLAMTDPTILDDAEGLGLATVLESRSPLPDALRSTLEALGFAAEATETGGRTSGGLLGLVGRSRKVRLDRWRYRHARAADLSPALGAFEDALIDALEDAEVLSLGAARAAVEDAAHGTLGLELPPGADGVAALERRLGLEARHRLVLHPSAVRALTGFLTAALLEVHPEATHDPEAEPPVIVPAPGLPPLGTDPEFRVVDWVIRGSRASPSRYLLELGREAAAQQNR